MVAEPSSTPIASSLPSGRPADARFETVWRIDRPYVIGLASRMLGDPAAAEDVVQEAFGRLMGVEMEEIDDVRAWLAVVVRRLCINRIRSAYTRRESVAGATPKEPDGLPSPDIGAGDPAERVTLDDQVRLALAVVLDRLTPAERTAFVLHDVFGFPFAAVAEIVGRTPAACRQLASRARRTVRSDAPVLDGGGGVVPDKDSTVAEQFIAACAGGEIADLVAVLDPDIVGEATLVGGGTLGGNHGAREVATEIVERFGPGSGYTLLPVPVEGDPGIVAILRGQVRAVIKLEVAEDGLVGHIDAFVLPPSRV